MFDKYTLRARVVPAVLALIPPLVLAVATVTSIRNVATVVGLLGAVATAVVAGLVRDRGKDVEPELFVACGGPPTRVGLRWRGNDAGAVHDLHAAVSKVSSVDLPTQSQELGDPDGADAKYDRAVVVLRELTRDAGDFPTVADELADYGFRRNTLGLRTIGAVVAVLTAVLAAVLLLVVDGKTDMKTAANATIMLSIDTMANAASSSRIAPSASIGTHMRMFNHKPAVMPATTNSTMVSRIALLALIRVSRFA